MLSKLEGSFTLSLNNMSASWPAISPRLFTDFLIHQMSWSKNELQPQVDLKHQRCHSVNADAQCKRALTPPLGLFGCLPQWEMIIQSGWHRNKAESTLSANTLPRTVESSSFMQHQPNRHIKGFWNLSIYEERLSSDKEMSTLLN